MNTGRNNEQKETDNNIIALIDGTVTPKYHIAPENLEALKKLAQDPKIEERFAKDIDHTVKKDTSVIQDNFRAGLSAYGDPFNVAHKAESGAGKTYTTMETFSYFPEEDVIIIGTQSPKVISHEQGELMTINTEGKEEPLNMDDEPREPKRRDYKEKDDYIDDLQTYKAEKKIWGDKVKNSFHLIRFAGKIYIILEGISHEALEMLKCTLSHDGPRIPHKFVDDKGKVHKTVLEGAPAFIFCTVDKEYIGEFATRVITDTPDTSIEKIVAAKEVISQKKSYPWDYEEDIQDKILIKALIRNIRDTIKQYKLKTVCPFENLDKEFPSEAARDMRDYDHFSQMLPTYTLFKLYQRPILTIKNKKYLVITIEDVLTAKKLFEEIAETTRTNTDKRVLDFYHTFVQHHKEGATLETILNHTFESGKEVKAFNEYAARRFLYRLEELGWVSIKEHEQVDKRRLTFYALKDPTEDEAEAAQQKLVASSCKSETYQILKTKLLKDFNFWLETISKRDTHLQASIICFSDRVETLIDLDQFKQIITGLDVNELLLVLNEETTSKTKTTSKTDCNPETQPDITTSPLEQVSTVPRPQNDADSRFCGDCGRFHLPKCGCIGGNFETLAADWWVGELRCWLPKQPEMLEFPEEPPTVEA
jgi:hypothetical protein